LSMNAINNLLQRRHSRIFGIIPNKSRSNTNNKISAETKTKHRLIDR
jgi:hypothetical protein